jgi:hypothetical protein
MSAFSAEPTARAILLLHKDVLFGVKVNFFLMFSQSLRIVTV